MINSLYGRVVLGSLVASCVALCGCGKSGPSTADMFPTNIKRLHSAYTMYWTAHGYKGPKDEQDFKDFLTNDRGAQVKLGRIGVPPEQLAGIFVSERDGQPFKIRYSVNGFGDHPVIFESEGVDGKRFVAYEKPRELESAEYETAWKGKAKIDKGLGKM